METKEKSGESSADKNTCLDLYLKNCFLTPINACQKSALLAGSSVY